jgi:hypothetical protein
MPVYVLLPKDRAPGEKRPAVITLHGHRSGANFRLQAGRIYPLLQMPLKRSTITMAFNWYERSLSSLHRMRGALARGGNGRDKRILRKRS